MVISVLSRYRCRSSHQNHAQAWIRGQQFQNVNSQHAVIYIIEDHLLKRGENPNKKGFIIFDTNQYKLLFNTNGEGITTIKHPNKNRIKLHIIQKEIISNITHKTIITALEDLNQLSLNMILSLRKLDNIDYSTGLQHAFWCQQYINSNIYINEMN